jgi:hypothetical protein
VKVLLQCARVYPSGVPRNDKYRAWLKNARPEKDTSLFLAKTST